MRSSLKEFAMNKRRVILAVLSSATLLSITGPAYAGAGGVPHGSPDTCGVGKAETVDFRADTTVPGVGEIKLYNPVAFGCTGNS
jgi:hypothetical protein